MSRQEDPMANLYDIPLKSIDGRQTDLGEHKGEVLLIVNVASKCGLTPQYEALEKLHEKYKGKKFSVLGFPANDFRGQEPGTNSEIMDFCTTNYGVTFPMYEKISVAPDQRHPLYKELIAEAPNATANPKGNLKERLSSMGLAPKNESDVLWNFEKFLVGRDGKVVQRFAPDFTPDDPTVTDAIERALKA
jgi:glutathione peroxidase